MGKLAAPVRADKEMMFTNRQLVALMWPLLLEQLLAITVGLADSLMVATVGDASPASARWAAVMPARML